MLYILIDFNNKLKHGSLQREKIKRGKECEKGLFICSIILFGFFRDRF